MDESSRLVIRNLDEQNLEDILRIHRAELAYSVNSRLGKQHLAFLYKVMSHDPMSYVGVGTIGDRPVGVISGTADVRRLRSSFMRSMSPSRFACITARFLTRPSLIVGWWQSRIIAAPVFQEGREVIAELTAIAVDPAYRGRGVGRRLVEALEAFLSAHDVYVYRLDTLVQNSSASDFYQALGFQKIAKRAGSLILIRGLGT